jgi:hypothetical protein
VAEDWATAGEERERKRKRKREKKPPMVDARSLHDS